MSKDKNDGVVNVKSAIWGEAHEITGIPDCCHEGVIDCRKATRKNNLVLLVYANIAISLAMRGL